MFFLIARVSLGVQVESMRGLRLQEDEEEIRAKTKNNIMVQKVVKVFLFSSWLITIHHLHAFVGVVQVIVHYILPDICFLV